MKLGADLKVRIISERGPIQFETAVNAVLAEGCWRVVETEMSVTDNHYYAMLVKSSEDRK